MTEPKKRGAPVKDAEKKNVQRTLGMPPALWKKVDEHGGQPWIREVIKKTKVPPLREDPPAE